MGKDESSAEALLYRHFRLEKEINAYSSEISRLEQQADFVTKHAASVVRSFHAIFPPFCIVIHQSSLDMFTVINSCIPINPDPYACAVLGLHIVLCLSQITL